MFEYEFWKDQAKQITTTGALLYAALLYRGTTLKNSVQVFETYHGTGKEKANTKNLGSTSVIPDKRVARRAKVLCTINVGAIVYTKTSTTKL